MTKNSFPEKKEITERLRGQMFRYRDNLKYTQGKVAELLEKDEKTYQRWESTGKGLSNLFDILNIFRTLQFPTTEIINVLGLPPLTSSEIKELYQDEKSLKSIREDNICSSIRNTCGEMDSFTIEKLLIILLTEWVKRRETLCENTPHSMRGRAVSSSHSGGGNMGGLL